MPATETSCFDRVVHDVPMLCVPPGKVEHFSKETEFTVLM